MKNSIQLLFGIFIIILLVFQARTDTVLIRLFQYFGIRETYMENKRVLNNVTFFSIILFLLISFVNSVT